MVRRTDRPLGQVRVSFETTRLSPQHLIAAYELLVPEVRHTCRPMTHCKAEPREITTAQATIRRGER